MAFIGDSMGVVKRGDAGCCAMKQNSWTHWWDAIKHLPQFFGIFFGIYETFWTFWTSKQRLAISGHSWPFFFLPFLATFGHFWTFGHLELLFWPFCPSLAISDHFEPLLGHFWHALVGHLVILSSLHHIL